MNKTKELKELFDEIKEFETPKKRSAGPNLVFGEGDENAEILFIGEAPGFYEAQEGRPFVGNAGKLLNKMLESIGLKREDVYITNLLRFRPPENRDPLPKEVEEYAPFLKRHIEIIKPKIIVTLGRFSMNYFLPNAKITRDHGKLQNGTGYHLYPVFHPAAALRDPQRMRELEEDFQKLPSILEKLREKDDNDDKKDKKGQLSLI